MDTAANFAALAGVAGESLIILKPSLSLGELDGEVQEFIRLYG